MQQSTGERCQICHWRQRINKIGVYLDLYSEIFGKVCFLDILYQGILMLRLFVKSQPLNLKIYSCDAEITFFFRREINV